MVVLPLPFYDAIILPFPQKKPLAGHVCGSAWYLLIDLFALQRQCGRWSRSDTPVSGGCGRAHFLVGQAGWLLQSGEPWGRFFSAPKTGQGMGREDEWPNYS